MDKKKTKLKTKQSIPFYIYSYAGGNIYCTRLKRDNKYVNKLVMFHLKFMYG